MVTSFEKFVGDQLAWYADGEGDMAHDVLRRIREKYIEWVGDIPEAEW